MCLTSHGWCPAALAVEGGAIMIERKHGRACTPWLQRRRGFTLIELLVVLAIVAVLAAILVPVVGTVRSAARGVVCTNNLRQIGMVMLNYVNDEDGYWPAAVVPSYGSLGSWIPQLAPYLELTRPATIADDSHFRDWISTHGTRLFWCPDALYSGGRRVAYADNTSCITYHYTLGNRFGSQNGGWVDCGDSTGMIYPADPDPILRAAQDARPYVKMYQRSVVLVESRVNPTNGLPLAANWGVAQTNYPDTVNIQRRHAGSSNYLFAGLHVKTSKPAIFDLDWALPGE